MGHASDLLSLSWPGAPSNHTIKFVMTKDLPPSGKIVITPQPGEFFIMPGFDYTDVDLATSSDANGIFIDRSLAAIASAVNDGVTVISSTTNGQITITLNSSYGITSGVWTLIKLGTNASFGDTGTHQVINPVATSSYTFEALSYDQFDNYLERAGMMVAIIEPVQATTYIIKQRFNGTPSGWLAFGTTQTIMSLMTNYRATCRYSTIASTSYDLMIDQFSYTGDYYHSVMINGLSNGQHYTYYILCKDTFNVVDDSEFIIDFEIKGMAGTYGDESGIPGGGGGGAGGGRGGGQGSGEGRGTGDFLPFPPPPGNPSVTFQGWAYPNSPVVLIKDGKEDKRYQASAQADFKIDLYDIKQGVYTFGLWAEDAMKRKSITQSFTFWIKEGTKTQIYGIFLPPTIEADKTNYKTGDTINLAGQSNPGGQVEIWFYPKKDGAPTDAEIIKKQTNVSTNGNWSLALPAAALSKGAYYIKARGVKDSKMSEFSNILLIGVDVTVQAGTCAGADLNHDGRVNLTDFSILLYWWGTSNECADQNQDGKVNLTDFSIMMFYWTG